VSNLYDKPGLAPVEYRIKMIEAAIRNDPWLRVDTWEAEQAVWTRTRFVLDHHHELAKKKFGESTQIRLLSG
jgi:nicotinamide mononucleotide adenylyltransferase